MAELGSFRPDKSEPLISSYNRTVVLMKNLKLVDANQDGLPSKFENTPSGKHLLRTLYMAYYVELNDPTLKRRVFQVKGWPKCTSLLQMHTLVTEEKNDMEEQARVEHEIKNSEWKVRDVPEDISNTPRKVVNFKNFPKASTPQSGTSKNKSKMKLRSIVSREGMGHLDYKKLFKNTMITMSMMDFYQ
ncbi:hypothetical protein EPUL_003774, partial [Erysiphe pulchra]